MVEIHGCSDHMHMLHVFGHYTYTLNWKGSQKCQLYPAIYNKSSATRFTHEQANGYYCTSKDFLFIMEKPSR